LTCAVSGENVNQAETSEDTQEPSDAGASETLGADAPDAISSQPAPENSAEENSAEENSAEENSAEESAAEESAAEPVADETPAPAPPPPAPAKAKKPAVESETDSEAEGTMEWYILKVAFNREDSIADALRKRVKMEGMSEFFGDIVVPTEDVATFTRDGKRRITKRKLLPGYIMVNMLINDDTWFLVRETNGISDFTGAAGKPMPMEPKDIERFITKPDEDEDEEAPVKIGIPFKVGDRVRVKEGNFENQEGEVDGVDEANGRITVIINIFGRSVPMELDHWQVEPL
jgi:transcriptional antiterminator NusG